jgi:hypothetical protein
MNNETQALLGDGITVPEERIYPREKMNIICVIFRTIWVSRIQALSLINFASAH